MKLRCGIVGAGRSRNGLGPFLASFLEQANCQVVAVAGRNQERAQSAAAGLEERLGHPVAACGSLQALLQQDLQALVIASPMETHLAALQAALAAGVPVLCEKPLLSPEQHAQIPALAEAFAEKQVLLMENCQWPMVLPAMDQLHPGWQQEPIRNISMRLSPTGLGRVMLVDSLSHYLSLCQALLPIGPETQISSLEFLGAGDEASGLDMASGLTVELVLQEPFPPVHGRFEMWQSESQPRPAWLAVNGRRMDRQIRMADYQIQMVAGDSCVSIDDPTAALVYRFAQSIREANLDQFRNESRDIQQRARFCQHIFQSYDQHSNASG